jgi:adenylate cyclase
MVLLDRLLHCSDQQHLPSRVQESIRRQKDSSEILIGWLQLCVVIVFSILYALSP